VIGARLARKEDPRLLRGVGLFGDDKDVPGQLWARVVRSPVAHGRLTAIGTAQARTAPGVAAVITAADLGEPPRIPVRLAVDGPDLTRYLQPVLAADTVRYVGEPVAVVVADDPYRAEDAADLVDLTIDERDPGHRVTAAELIASYGDVAAAFGSAAHVTRIELSIGRHSAVPLEPRCLLAVPGPALDIYGMTKVPVHNRDLLARLLRMDRDLIRVHGVDAGGGFGVRGEFYPEDFLVPWLATTLGRPVKWTEDRAEHMVAANHSRQQRHNIAAASDRTGRLLALTDDIRHDNGAYARTHGVAVAELTIAMLPGPYRVPAYRGRIAVELTCKTPCGTYRAPGRFEGTAAREHLLDVAAGELGIDRIELRRRNLLSAAELPHKRPIRTLGTDMVLEAGDYIALLDQTIEAADRGGFRSKAAPPHLRYGFGLAMFAEKSGLGPRDTATVTVNQDGSVRVDAGGTSFGQGIETVLAQIAADALGVEPGAVSVTTGDTHAQPRGTGSWASRSTVMAGSAVYEAARTVRKNQSASETSTFETDRMTYPYGVHAVQVAVDTRTGQVRVLKYLIGYEVGRAVNPMLVEGQLRGGAAQGIGGALLEEFRYDQAGQPLATSFLGYLLPTAGEVPPVQVLLSERYPSPGNPLGVMGAGEGGITGAGAAIANAVRDALGGTGSVGRLPLTPGRIAELCT
jgi:carbon-monoxide dehydrogenase large subunit/6-hydroxypseudooxynicotine dehydrogenase subunit gamma